MSNTPLSISISACHTVISVFLVSHFNCLLIPSGRLSWLTVSVLLDVKYTLSYRMSTFVSAQSIQIYVHDTLRDLPEIGANSRYQKAGSGF